MHIPMSEEDKTNFFSYFDSNLDGRISIQEFTDVFRPALDQIMKEEKQGKTLIGAGGNLAFS
jgi:Ca2+-binding EF-hand superfamily protein